MKNAILGIYEAEELLISTLKKMRVEKIEIREVFTPYPVHEVFKIMKRKTNLPFVTFFFAIAGLILSYYYAYWTSVISYPLSYGGKPLHSIPSFILIGFISMISFGVLFSVITFLFRTRLYPGKKPIIFDFRITDYAFVIVIEKKPEMSSTDIKTINSILNENGAVEVLEKQIY